MVVTTGLDKLTERQRQLVAAWLPGLTVVADHSWGLVDTTVLEVTCDGRPFVVKAAGASDHHLAREVRAHRLWLRPWTSLGRAPELVQADLDAKILLTRYLPGRLVLGSAAARDPETFRQAGELLGLFHRQAGSGVTDDAYERRENAKALACLDQPHRILATVAERLRAEVASWPTPPTISVPTHGDWQPRNWLVQDGVVGVIDLGRADLRPPATDLARLAARDFRGAPDLESAFLDGYGADPREPEGWHRLQVREAIGTAVWAFQVGDEDFEAHGHRMLADALPETGTEAAAAR